MANETNCPIAVPGYKHNGDCNLICKPTEWTDILTFFLGNYAAHAATIIGRPGQSDLTSVLSILIAVCLPGAGVLTGIHAIASLAVLAPTELTKAVRAGALCIVVKGDNGFKKKSARQNAENKSVVEGTSFRRGEVLERQPDEVFPPSISCTKVQGISRLPAGYRLLVLPSWTTFANDAELETDSNKEISKRGCMSILPRRLSRHFKPQKKLKGEIACSYNMVKVLISLGQLLFAAVTLYQARGNQVEVYGSAAFGLTVAPYVWMSFINLLGNLLCPQYETMFIVNSPTLDRLKQELRSRGLSERYPLDGAVGRITGTMEAKVLRTHEFALKPSGTFEMYFNSIDSRFNPAGSHAALRNVILAFIIAAVPIAIVGGISRFKAGSSATYQRVWTMIWLCMGPPIGVSYGMIIAPLSESRPALWRMMTSRSATTQEEQDPDSPSDSQLPRQSNTMTSTAGDRSYLSGPQKDTTVFKAYNFMFLALFISAFIYMVPAIGGFVVVGEMLKQYGTCVKTN